MDSKLPDDLRPDEAMHVLHFLHAMPGTSALLKITLQPLIWYEHGYNETQLICIRTYQNDRRGLRQFNHAEEVLLKDVPSILETLEGASAFFEPQNQRLKVEIFVNNSPCTMCTPKLLQFREKICSLGFTLKSLIFSLQFQHIYKPDKNSSNIRSLRYGGVQVGPLKWAEFYESFSTWMKLNRSEMQSSSSEQTPGESQSPMPSLLSADEDEDEDKIRDEDATESDSDESSMPMGASGGTPMSRPTGESDGAVMSKPFGASDEAHMSKHTGAISGEQLSKDEDIIRHLYTVSKDWAVQFKLEQNRETRRELDSLM